MAWLIVAFKFQDNANGHLFTHSLEYLINAAFFLLMDILIFKM